MPGLYGYSPSLPPSVDMGEPLDDPMPAPEPAPRGVMIAGDIKNIEIETDLSPVAEAVIGLGVAIAGVEEAVNALPDKLADAPDDYTPIIEAIDRLAALIESHHADMKASEGPVTQTIRRDASGNVVSITTKKGKETPRTRTIIRNASGLITGTVEE